MGRFSPARGRRLAAFLGACGINLLLLALIPFFFQTRPLPRKLPACQPVPVWLPRRPPRPTAPTTAPKEPIPPKKLRLPPLAAAAPPPASPAPRVDIDLPAVDLRPDLHSLATVPLPAPAASLKTLYQSGEVDRQPTAMANPAPFYPPAARRRGITGRVKVRFVVDNQGRVGKIRIIAAEPPGFFEQTVISTLRRWHFRPGMVAGRAVNTEMETTIVFKLEK